MPGIREFFNTAADILIEERRRGPCTYMEAIRKAEERYGMTHEQLRKMCGVIVKEGDKSGEKR